MPLGNQKGSNINSIRLDSKRLTHIHTVDRLNGMNAEINTFDDWKKPIVRFAVLVPYALQPRPWLFRKKKNKIFQSFIKEALSLETLIMNCFCWSCIFLVCSHTHTLVKNSFYERLTTILKASTIFVSSLILFFLLFFRM